jgi:uncharacterized protein YdhG (YjbR/CyaY superfamily)
MDQSNYSTIDEYIASFPNDIQRILETVRETIHREAPLAQEKISYGMPAFCQGKNLIYFAAMKHHIGLYPGSEAVAVFAPRLTEYKTSKGAIQFPLSAPVPYDLIAEITRFRVKAVEGTGKK